MISKKVKFSLLSRAKKLGKYDVKNKRWNKNAPSPKTTVINFMNFGKYKSCKDYTPTKNDVRCNNYINQRLSAHPCGYSNDEADKDCEKNWIEKNHNNLKF